MKLEMIEGKLFITKEIDLNGDVDLSGTVIAQLPDNLSVGGSLYLTGTAITSLPDGLSVGGTILGYNP